MSGNVPWIAIGTEWITVCNGFWHSVFLADDRSLYPGPCTCASNEPRSALIRDISSLLDAGSGEERGLRESSTPEERQGSSH